MKYHHKEPYHYISFHSKLFWYYFIDKHNKNHLVVLMVLAWKINFVITINRIVVNTCTNKKVMTYNNIMVLLYSWIIAATLVGAWSQIVVTTVRSVGWTTFIIFLITIDKLVLSIYHLLNKKQLVVWTLCENLLTWKHALKTVSVRTA